jgi:4-aminobutyrate aminotransferase / (S)-3-amino-2-methylpropionate transaminase / 5-aminovalerate transaminase
VRELRRVTEIPGPQSRSLLARRQRVVSKAICNETPLFIAKGRGAVVEDVDGNEYVDFAGGVGALNVGHASPDLVEAVKKQSEKFMHVSFQIMMYESFVALLERLAELTPGQFPKKGMFANSGAEAIENSVKLARAYTRRPGVVTFFGGFHGRTLLAMTLTTKHHPFKAHYGPYAPAAYRVPFAYCYRCPLNLRYPSCEVACADSLQEMLETSLSGDEVAAVVAEPVLGEGGFVVPPPEFWPIIKRTCERYGILFIADEIQTGFCRTGKMFASEHWELEPDLMVLSKSLAAGVPLSAVVGRAEVLDAPDLGGLGGTFGGSPLGCTAALKVIEKIERDRLVERAQAVGNQIRTRFLEMKERFSLIGDVRALGAMVAMELVRDPETKEPATKETDAVLKICYENGLIILSAGLKGNVIRCLAPLVIADDELALGLDILERAIAQVTS